MTSGQMADEPTPNGGTHPSGDGREAEATTLYLESAHRQVKELDELVREAECRPDAWPQYQQAIGEISHNVKGQGGCFGYPLMTRIGQSLLTLAKATETAEPAILELFAAHVAALRAVLDKDITGSGGELGNEVAAGLEDLVEQAIC